jgi:hypothetical protein
LITKKHKFLGLCFFCWLCHCVRLCVLARVMRLWRVVSASPKLPLCSSHHSCASVHHLANGDMTARLRAITSPVGDTTCACAHYQFLRLLTLLSLLYLPYSTERTPKELRLNSPPTKSDVC